MRKRTTGRASTGGRRRSQASRVVDEDEDEAGEVPDYRYKRRPRYVSEDEEDTDELAMGPNVCLNYEPGDSVMVEDITGRLRLYTEENSQSKRFAPSCERFREKAQARC